MPDGQFVGRPIQMQPWQIDILKGIYDTPTRLAIISVGRKNGKTSLAAMLLLLHLCGPESRPNSELYSSALSRDQASIIFRLASKMIRLGELREHVTIRDTVKQLHVPELGTLYQALSADASTNFGLSPVFVCHDELGQVKGERHALYEALETATGAQKNPLSIVISTQAPSDGDLLSRMIDDAGSDEHAETTKLFLWAAKEDADPFSDETIRQANPAFDEFQNADEIRRMAAEAKRMPSREAAYRNLILNQRVEVYNPFVSKAVWEENGGEPEFGDEWYGGLDLSETKDLTSLELISFSGGAWGVESTFWLPEEGLADRARQDRVPYDKWRDQGHLKVTPGRSIEYEYVAAHLANLFETRDIRKIAFDRYNMRHLRPWLVKAGLSESFIDDRFVEFGQGYYSMSPALRNFESLLLNKRLRHGLHPILRMCAANAVVKTDEAGSRKLDKNRSRGRIDGMVALAMACEVANANASTSEGVMKAGWLKYWDSELDGKGNRYIVVHAPHEKKPHPETVMWVLELREDRNYYALEMVREKLNPAERAELLLDLHRKYGPLRVGYEKRGWAVDVSHIEDLQSRENYRFRVDELKVPLSENERVMRLVPLLEAGRIVLPQKHVRRGVDMVEDFRKNEFLPYPYGFHADMLEGLSMILDMRTAFPSGTGLSLDDVIAEGHL